ncbi:MAG: hypothetical protein BIFFINMI_00478 [Phycisphaerae bacterium]|nr:hypothetical protein [Phycisphaerae bacterium]
MKGKWLVVAAMSVVTTVGIQGPVCGAPPTTRQQREAELRARREAELRARQEALAKEKEQQAKKDRPQRTIKAPDADDILRELMQMSKEGQRLAPAIRAMDAGKQVPPDVEEEVKAFRAKRELLAGYLRTGEESDPRKWVSPRVPQFNPNLPIVPGGERDPFLKGLLDSFTRQVEKDPDADLLKRAAQCLLARDAEDVSPLYHVTFGIVLVRKLRSSTAVPLLLYYMAKSEPGVSDPRAILCKASVQVLTGEQAKVEIEPEDDAEGRMRKEAERLAKVVLNPDGVPRPLNGNSTPAQWRVRVQTLCWLCSHDRNHSWEVKPQGALDSASMDFTVRACIDAGVVATNTWLQADLSDEMVPYFLELAGYAGTPEAQVNTRPADARFPYDAIAPLFRLHHFNQSPLLEKVVNDTKQPAAVQLLALLAVNAVDCQLPLNRLVAIAQDKDQPSELRMIAVSAMRYCPDEKATIGRLRSLLLCGDGPVVGMAAMTLGTLKAEGTEIDLGRLLHQPDVSNEVITSVLGGLSRMRTDSATTVLQGFLRTTMNDPAKAAFLRPTLYTYMNVIGYMPGRALATEQELRDEAVKAMNWSAGHARRPSAPRP